MFLASANPERGRTIMRSGLGRDVQPCISCHGINGEPLSGSNVPRLSGQGAWYLAKQLDDYAGGARQNQVMTQYARLLTPQQRADVAVAWSERTVAYVSPAPSDPAVLARGKALVEAGDSQLRLRACSSCHVAGLHGAYAAVPYISGQHPDYTLAALQDWLSGRRSNDVAGVMRAVVAKLVPEDRRAVAAYLARLPPPTR